jgi:hypothetical protein
LKRNLQRTFTDLKDGMQITPTCNAALLPTRLWYTRHIAYKDALYASVVVLLALLGELPLALWLLIKGINVHQWEKRTLEPAFTSPRPKG